MNRRFILDIVIALTATLAAINIFLFGGRHYSAAALLAAFLACVPFYFSFERRGSGGREIMLISVMTALSVCGRIIFGFIPFFKPVTALTIIGGMYFGCTPGFMIGSFSALISNIYFGHGPWTVFQMLSWGLIGCFAGLLGKALEKRAVLVIYGIISGVLFSLLMDIWTVLSIDGAFSLERYLAQLAAGLPITISYALSNVIFLLMLQRPLGRKLERAKIKYGAFSEKS